MFNSSPCFALKKAKRSGLKVYFKIKQKTVLKRLGVYHDQTQPLIDYYTQSGILKEVDGTIDIDDVFAEIVRILGE